MDRHFLDEYLCTDDKKTGQYIEWYENGQKKIECYYVDDILNGHYISWYENGQMWEECDYVDGKKMDII